MATIRKVYIQDNAWQELKAALKQEATSEGDHAHPDGSIRLYSDNGAGGHLDVVMIYKKSVQPEKH